MRPLLILAPISLLTACSLGDWPMGSASDYFLAFLPWILFGIAWQIDGRIDAVKNEVVKLNQTLERIEDRLNGRR